MHNELQQARQRTDELFAIVHPAAIYDRPIPERHRIIFYIGHLEAFDWNLLSPGGGLEAFEPALDRLFAFGIDPLDTGLPSDTPGDWPSLPVVLAYRDQVRARLDRALSSGIDPLLLNVAIEHRLMHAETLAYLFHQLPAERKTPPSPPERIVDAPPPDNDPVEVSEGTVRLGLRRAGNRFGWDNEFEAHDVRVPAFAIDRHKVTNAQFARFVEEGGYRDRSLWTAEDWAWLSRTGIWHPLFWVRRRGAWMYRSMFDEILLPPHWPVSVSHAEASAYCRWADAALPLEPQWQRAAEGCRWWAPERSDAWDPWPVSAVPSGRSAFGVEGMISNGWEWTSTPFHPFEGFEPFPFYRGYSADFFDGRHYVMKGGSVRTAGRLQRPSFRNWFQPHYPYVYAGFRCVRR